MAWETAVVLGIIAVPALLLFIMLALKQKEHQPIRLLLLLISFLLIGAILVILMQIAEPNDAEINNVLDAVFRGWIPVFLFVVFWFVLYFFIDVVAAIRRKRRRPNG